MLLPQAPHFNVASREGRVSRNLNGRKKIHPSNVASREGRVSRNAIRSGQYKKLNVASREGRVSRNKSRSGIGGSDASSRPARDV